MSGETASNDVGAKPSGIIQAFLCTMVALLLVTLPIGQLNLPFYGATAWDLGAAALQWVANEIPVLARFVAEHFFITVGVLGTSWITLIHLRVQRTGRYVLTAIDAILAVCAVGLLAVYFCYLELVLPLDVTFFYRVSLYCAIATMVFGVGVWASALAEKLEPGMHEAEVWMLLLLFIGGVVAGIASASIGEGFGFSGMNAVLHVFANVGAAAMGVGYQCRVAFQARQRSIARAKAEQAEASAA